jgi:HlyD family secretion protein
MRRWLGAGITVVVLLVAGGLAHQSKGSPDGRYRIDTIDRGDITMTVTATGTLSSVTTVQVGSQVSGIIAALYADFNSAVKKGQLLAELDPTSFQAQVEQQRANVAKAEVDVANAKITFDRQEHLLAAGLTAQADDDAARTAYESARASEQQAAAALRQAQTNLGYTKIISPIDGVVVARQYDVGQTVAASFQAPTLFTIAQDLTKMQVQADVDQSDIGRVRVGEDATFTVDAYPEQVFHGSISQIRLDATVSQNVITYPVIIDVANPDLKLRPEMTANVTIEVAKAGDVLRVANAALRFRPASPAGQMPDPADGGADASRTASRANGHAGPSAKAQRGAQTVFRLSGSEDLAPVAIRTGISDGRYTEIVGGELHAGDRIVAGYATTRGEGSVRTPGLGRF